MQQLPPIKSDISDKVIRCICVGVTLWRHHLDSNETFGDKAWWELHKDAACCFEQIMKAAPNKTAAVRPLTPHLTNHHSKTVLHTQHNNKDERHSSLEKYTSHFIWKGCVWEGVGDRTELQHIDPHSYGHQRFFPVLLGCSTGGQGPSLSGCWFSLPHLIFNSSDPQAHWISCALSYITVQRPLNLFP